MEKPAALLLERDANVISVAQHCLSGEVELHVVNTVELAVRVASRRPVVVAVLDATMAGLNPSDTVARLRAQKPALRILFLAEPAFDLDRRYGQLGSILRKPVTEERLADTIRNVLRLRNMSEGVERMRSSSGTYRAVRGATEAHVPPSSNAPPAPTSNLPPRPIVDASPSKEGKSRGTRLLQQPPIPREDPDSEDGPHSDPVPSQRNFSPLPFARVR